MTHIWKAVIVIGLAACSAHREDALGVRGFEIMGGLVAPRAELDHTGALVKVDPATGTRSVVCTATLIAPETAVTAKHCADAVVFSAAVGETMAWAGGVNVGEAKLVPIVAVEVPEAGDPKGALGVGYDVGLLHFDEPVQARPALPKPFDPQRIRGSMVTLGYGMTAAWTASDGLRRIGREEVVATAGAVYEILYGSFESYLEVELTGETSDEDYLALIERDPTLVDLDQLRDDYSETGLIPAHEIITKTFYGDTRSCRGDSGGPLLLVSERGEWEVYGVLSGGPGSLRAACDFGQVYATFGPVTFPFIEAGLAWTDPCDNTGALGRCDGSIVERCETNVAAHVRQRVMSDCAASLKNCRMGERGAECTDR